MEPHGCDSNEGCLIIRAAHAKGVRFGMQLTPRYDGPTLLHVDEAIGDPSAPLIRQRRRLVEELRTLRDDEWRAPSRCDGWTVQDVVLHLISTNQFWGMSIGAGLAATPTRFLATFDPVATPPQLIAPLRALPPAEVLDRLAQGVEALADTTRTLDDDALARLAEGPPGHIAIRAVLLHALWDSWIHERDILVPLGRRQALEDDELMGSLAYAAALGPAFAATAGSTREGTLVVDATDPDTLLIVDEGTTVTVRLGDRQRPPTDDPGTTLTGSAVELIEALSFRAPFPAPLDEQDQWLLGGLGEVFDRTA